MKKSLAKTIAIAASSLFLTCSDSESNDLVKRLSVPTRTGLDDRIAKLDRTRNSRNNTPENYALIINTQRSNVESISLAYQTLIEHGYHPHDIFILCDRKDQVIYPSLGTNKKTEAEKIMRHLKRSLGPEDNLLVYLDAPSFYDARTREHLFNFGEDTMRVTEFRDFLAGNTRFNKAIVLLNQQHPEELRRVIYGGINPSYDFSLVSLAEQDSCLMEFLGLVGHSYRSYDQRNRTPYLRNVADNYGKMKNHRQDSFNVEPTGSLTRKRLN